MKVALAYNLKEKDETKPVDYFSEFDSQETVNAITLALEKRGHQVLGVNVGQADIFSYFRKKPADSGQLLGRGSTFDPALG